MCCDDVNDVRYLKVIKCVRIYAALCASNHLEFTCRKCLFASSDNNAPNLIVVIKTSFLQNISNISRHIRLFIIFNMEKESICQHETNTKDEPGCMYEIIQQSIA